MITQKIYMVVSERSRYWNSESKRTRLQEPRSGKKKKRVTGKAKLFDHLRFFLQLSNLQVGCWSDDSKNKA